jgi:hypothetical protein
MALRPVRDKNRPARDCKVEYRYLGRIPVSK